MILIIPAKKVDLTGMPRWFVRLYAGIYIAAFFGLLATAGYVILQLGVTT